MIPVKFPAGIAIAYSMPSDLKTSTMKSEAGRSLAAGEVGVGADSLEPAVPPCVAGACVSAKAFCATNPAAPAVAPLRNLRRSIEVLLSCMRTSLEKQTQRKLDLPGRGRGLQDLPDRRQAPLRHDLAGGIALVRSAGKHHRSRG